MIRTVRAFSVIAFQVLIACAIHAAPSSDVSAEDVRALIAERRYEEAAASARALVGQAERLHGEDSLELAESLQLLARAMTGGHVGELSDRLEPAERAVAIKRRLLHEGDPALAEAVYRVGFVYYFAGDPRRALPHYEEALRIAESHYGIYHSDLERYVREYGVVLYSVERYVEARSEFERLHVISLDKYGAEEPGMYPALANLALVHKALEEYD